MKENDEYLSGLSHKKVARVAAWICLIIITALVIATLVTGIMGSRLFLPFLALTIVVPFLMYIALWFGRVLSGSGVDTAESSDNIDDK
ncbi:MAG: hypothetical protein IJ054_10060 [Lachnospiraceae bacterium]|nr:hypothetical protein [Lachnospiraceae bacterium]